MRQSLRTESGSIQWLEVKSTMDYHEIGYSVDNPMEDSQAQLTWVEFDRDAYGSISLEGLSAFSGLKKLTVSRSLRREDLKGLKLESIGGYFASLEETAGLVENPEELREVRTTGSQFSLQGIDKMPEAGTLSIDGEQDEEMKASGPGRGAEKAVPGPLRRLRGLFRIQRPAGAGGACGQLSESEGHQLCLQYGELKEPGIGIWDVFGFGALKELPEFGTAVAVKLR